MHRQGEHALHAVFGDYRMQHVVALNESIERPFKALRKKGRAVQLYAALHGNAATLQIVRAAYPVGLLHVA